MADLTFGEVDWNTADAGAGNRGPRTEFIRLEQGATTVRIMGQPVQFHVNWVDTAEGKRRKINTPVEDTALVQQLEDAGYKRQTRWLLKVLDRSDDTFRLLEIGPQIFRGIRDLVKNPKWGKVTNYDITINKGPKGTQPLYSVQPDPKEALPESLKASWTEFNDNLNLERLITPSDPAYVYELLGWSAPGSSSASTETGSSEEGDAFDFDFED